MSLIKPALSLLSPAAHEARLSILIFHRVLPEQDPIFPGEAYARWFDQMLGWLKQWCNVLPLDEAVQRLAAGTLPARAAAITFDDGYADNHDVALPLLRSHGLSATFFIATGFLDGGRMWNDTVIEAVRHCQGSALDLRGLNAGEGGQLDCYSLASASARQQAIGAIIGRIKYLPVAERQALTEEIALRAGVRPADDLMMDTPRVRALRQAGMQIGAHTVSHPILAGLSAEEARQEIADSRRTLEGILGERVGLFAYPNGKPGADYSPESVTIARELGFDAAVSTAPGAAVQGSDPFQLPRFTPWDRSRHRFGLRLAQNLWQARTA
ncbi:polysaccharide deacetylase family protein [Chitinimonas sp.]|uniref:polysaccharide deacetylase family protein n=1 Tax=Chitinimonas sp. TaxID=1934313 RepID=UPI002F943BBC